MAHFDVEENIAGERTLTYSFSERVDTANCLTFEKELMNKVRESKIPVIFDLEKVDYIASIFLGLCVRVAKEVGFQNFTIINSAPDVRKVFKIAGLDKRISIS